MATHTRTNRFIVLAVVLTALVVAPLTVVASHTFTDVPDSNPHHADIAWLKEAGVTLGCNPPANDEFCPDSPVLRQQMASFLRRLAENQVVDAATAITSQSSESAVIALTADSAETIDGIDSENLVQSPGQLSVFAAAQIGGFGAIEARTGPVASATRESTGVYLVSFSENLPTPVVVNVTGVSTGGVQCSWSFAGGTSAIRVRCHTPAGDAGDTVFGFVVYDIPPVS